MVSATRPRDVAMADVDRCFDQLPAGLDELVIAVRGRLGRPGEYFLAEDDRFPPVLDVHAWVIDDIGAGGDDALEQELFVSGYFRLAALAAHQMVLDGSNGLRSELGLAVPVFGHLADARLARVLPPDSPAWASVHTAVVDAARAGVERYLTQSDLLAVSGRRWAPMISLTLAGVHHARRSDLLRPLIDLLYRIYDVADVRGELHNLRADAQGGAPSYPVWRVSLEAGLPRGAPPDRVIGALLTTACAARIIDETRRRTAAARIAADQLGLRRIVDYLDDVESSFGELAGTVAAGAALAEIAGAGRMCTPAPRTESPRLREASARALDFLLDDENMREAWDVHRTGFLGMDVRESGARSPSASRSRISARRAWMSRTPRSGSLRSIASTPATTSTVPCRLPRDIDTLGLMLRVRSRLAGALPVDELLERPIPGLMRAGRPRRGASGVVGRVGSERRAGHAPGNALRDQSGEPPAWAGATPRNRRGRAAARRRGAACLHADPVRCRGDGLLFAALPVVDRRRAWTLSDACRGSAAARPRRLAAPVQRRAARCPRARDPGAVAAGCRADAARTRGARGIRTAAPGMDRHAAPRSTSGWQLGGRAALLGAHATEPELLVREPNGDVLAVPPRPGHILTG